MHVVKSMRYRCTFHGVLATVTLFTGGSGHALGALGETPTVTLVLYVPELCPQRLAPTVEQHLSAVHLLP